MGGGRGQRHRGVGLSRPSHALPVQGRVCTRWMRFSNLRGEGSAAGDLVHVALGGPPCWAVGGTAIIASYPPQKLIPAEGQRPGRSRLSNFCRLTAVSRLLYSLATPRRPSGGDAPGAHSTTHHPLWALTGASPAPAAARAPQVGRRGLDPPLCRRSPVAPQAANGGLGTTICAPVTAAPTLRSALPPPRRRRRLALAACNIFPPLPACLPSPKLPWKPSSGLRRR